MQQSLTYQVLAASTITNGDGTTINPNGGDNTWNIRPDAVNGKTGFKEFGKIDLSQGDILNFIYSYINQSQSGTGNDLTLVDNLGKIDAFIALVKSGVKIDGIVNALQNVNGALKNDGNLVFISPNGMVVGASGVLNVGNLSVISPTQSSYKKLSDYLNLPQQSQYYINHYTVAYDASNPENTSKIVADGWDYSKNTSAMTDKTLNLSTLTDGAGNQLVLGGGAIRVDAGGKIAARGNVDLQGGTIANNGLLIAGIGGNTEVLTDHSAADTLFTNLVNTDNMNTGNTFSSNNGNISIKSVTGTSVGNGAIVHNYGNGNVTIDNSGADGINIAGRVSNLNGKTTITNTNGGLLVDSTGLIASGIGGADSTLEVSNEGNGGMNIKGSVVANHGNKTNTVNFVNKNSNMSIGSTGVNKNITSNANVNIAVTNGNLLNNGVANTLIYTTNGADLNATVTNGRIGDEVGPNYNCDGGVCTGIGPSGRDLTKSVNTSIDGVITATSTAGSNTSLINMASLNKNMNVNQIKADGRVILLADSSTKGASPYSIVNRSKNSANPNVEGTGISLIASGNIGEAKTSTKSATPLTFRQNGYAYNPSRDDAQLPHDIENVNKTGNGVDMLAIGNIDVKGMDAEDGTKLDTKACAIIARTGDINAEFSGNVYVGETAAANNINLTTRGKNMYVEHLGEVPSYGTDYYGENKNPHPTRAKLVALDLGTQWIDSENPEYRSAADSTIVVKMVL